MNEPKPIIDDAFRRQFARAMSWVIGGGFVAMLAMVFIVSRLNQALLGEAVVIAIGSIVVASLAMLPGLLSRRQDDGIVVNLMAGIPIRMVGTVALFLTCRYQLASPTETIAAMAISWYLLLTFIEVVVLVRQSPAATKPRSLRTDNSLPANA
jgi:hypothetical protein